MATPDQIRNAAIAAMNDFLVIDADMALSFLQLADNTDDPKTRQRRLAAATEAYRRIVALMSQVIMTGEQKALLENKLTSIRSRLTPV